MSIVFSKKLQSARNQSTQPCVSYCARAQWVAQYHPRTKKGRRFGYCIVHNPLLLQPLRHWFTFIFRKHEHLAVGSLDKGLTCSHGRPVWVASSSPCVFIITHFVGLSSLIFYREDTWREPRGQGQVKLDSWSHLPIGCSISPWHLYCITNLSTCQHFFWKVFGGACSRLLATLEWDAFLTLSPYALIVSQLGKFVKRKFHIFFTRQWWDLNPSSRQPDFNLSYCSLLTLL